MIKYIGEILCVIAIIVFIIVLILIKKKGTKVSKEISNANKSELIKMDNSKGTTFDIEMLPAENFAYKERLSEITDSEVLAHINNLVPELAQVGNAVNNVAQTVQNNREVLYRVIVPKGTKLTNSKSMQGAVRGIYHGDKGIKGHANLIEAERNNGNAIITNSLSGAISFTSMIVGQYYMTQINSQLNNINTAIEKITEFQDNKFRSEVFSLITHIREVSDFQMEIIENNELRLSKILQLDRLKEQCTVLLGQANLALAGYANRKDIDYKEYEKEIEQAQNWYMYQKALLDVLCKISELKYTLHFGEVSREQCSSILSTYMKQVKETQERLVNWHQEVMNKLNIDTDENRRKRKGFDGAIHFIPGLFNDDWNYKEIDNKTVAMIETQTSGYEETFYKDTTDLYEKDVQVVLMDGKIYYLPMDENEEVKSLNN